MTHYEMARAIVQLVGGTIGLLSLIVYLIVRPYR